MRCYISTSLRSFLSFSQLTFRSGVRSGILKAARGFKVRSATQARPHPSRPRLAHLAQYEGANEAIMARTGSSWWRFLEDHTTTCRPFFSGGIQGLVLQGVIAWFVMMLCSLGDARGAHLSVKWVLAVRCLWWRCPQSSRSQTRSGCGPERAASNVQRGFLSLHHSSVRHKLEEALHNWTPVVLMPC